MRKFIAAIGLFGLLGLSTSLLAAPAALVTFDWSTLNFGSRQAVTGVFNDIRMDWDNTKHNFLLGDGRTKKNKWYEKKLGKRIYEFDQADGSKKVRYDTIKAGATDIDEITVKIKDKDNVLLDKDTYVPVP